MKAPDDPRDLLTADYWDARYRGADRIWSGDPNRRLVEQVEGLPPGAALDLGCGEGGDAIWLAERGWQVTAADVSQVALDRAEQHARSRGQRSITWQQVDALEWTPPAQAFDLISVQYLHMPWSDVEALLSRLVPAVRTGGSLLVVAHDKSDLHTSMGRPDLPDFFFTADQLVATLDPASWQLRVAEAQPREALDPHGAVVVIHDAVVHAVRR